MKLFGIIIGSIVSIASFTVYCNSRKAMFYRSDFGNPKKDLIELKNGDLGLVFDIKYATKDNFVGNQIYSKPFVYVHKDIMPKLKLASDRAQQLGYKIKIFDAFRPYEAQKIMWNAFKDPRYVSNPDTGPCGHCRGCAIDITLIDGKTGQEIDMGTQFDSFDERSNQTTLAISDDILRNRAILSGIMLTSGFVGFEYEWWHFQIEDMVYLYPKYKAKDLDSEMVVK